MSRTLPRFPMSNAWLTNHDHAYIPRHVTADTMSVLVSKLLKEDKPFLHLLRQCKTHWYISAVVGQTTLSMDIYQGDLDASVNDGLVSQPSYRKQAVYLKVDRELLFEPVDERTIQRLRQQIPLTYSTRRLRPSEIIVCDTLADVLKPTARPMVAQVDTYPLSVNLLNPDTDLESGSAYRNVISD